MEFNVIFNMLIIFRSPDSEIKQLPLITLSYVTVAMFLKLTSVVVTVQLFTQTFSVLPRVKVNRDSYFQDVEGRVRIFHGNSWVHYDDVPEISNENMEIAVRWGINVARVGFMWHVLEPSPGVYNRVYLAKLSDLIQRLADHGIYTILDLHQDFWAPVFCGHGIPDFYAEPYDPWPLPGLHYYRKGQPRAFPQPQYTPQYAPNETANFPHITNCERANSIPVFGQFGRYSSFALGAAAQRLYNNDTGLMDIFKRLWRDLANIYKNQTHVLGYEVLNEPWMGDVWADPLLLTGTHADLVNLGPMYTSLNQAIRSVDNDTIFFFEPSLGGSFFGEHTPVGFKQGPGGPAYNDRQALSYHIYCLGNTVSGPECAFLNTHSVVNRELDIARLGVGGLLTEFAWIDQDSALNDAEAVSEAIDLMNQMDQHLRGWVFWKLYPNSQSDPRGEHLLGRTYAQAIAGKPTYMKFDSNTGNFTFIYQPASSNTIAAMATEIYANFAQYYPNGMTCTLTPVDVGNCTQYNTQNKVIVQLNAEHLDTAEVRVSIVAN